MAVLTLSSVIPPFSTQTKKVSPPQRTKRLGNSKLPCIPLRLLVLFAPLIHPSFYGLGAADAPARGGGDAAPERVGRSLVAAPGQRLTAHQPTRVVRKRVARVWRHKIQPLELG